MTNIKVIRENGYYCSYCMEEVGKGIDRVAAVYDWQNPLKVVGYYCPYHWQQVYDFDQKQKAAYENMSARYKTREKK
ncbi:hypothetical protein IHV12_19775 [Fictibacillus sp. 7GRE50]|uniref:hypothetical protein n=1 Tax=Fictibacillus sp. 7GRE50 TaxID=2745878 RepID=UPI0018CCAB4C|nr:hypothetical protein [Fictibacillus sp. 7GRE50]MBH0167168.1 hypothetical protein [Fictibacillus sp. 7GRE50]